MIEKHGCNGFGDPIERHATRVAPPDAALYFIADMVASGTISPGTASGYMYGVQRVYQEAGYATPFDDRARRMIKGGKRSHGRPAKKRPAMTLALLLDAEIEAVRTGDLDDQACLDAIVIMLFAGLRGDEALPKTQTGFNIK
jgi:hypothetical protein